MRNISYGYNIRKKLVLTLIIADYLLLKIYFNKSFCRFGILIILGNY